MRVLIFSNENAVQKQLKKMISEKHPECFVEAVASVNDAEQIKKKDFDVLFVDACLEKNSKENIRFLGKLFPESKIIFISDEIGKISDLMPEIVPFGVIEYPLDSKEVSRYYNLVKEDVNRAPQKFYFNEKGRRRSLMFSNIMYLESNRERLFIKTVRSDLVLWMKMSEAESQFPDYFVRCHNSFLVNMKFVAEHERNCLRLVNGQEIVVSRSRKEMTTEKLNSYMDSTR